MSDPDYPYSFRVKISWAWADDSNDVRSDCMELDFKEISYLVVCLDSLNQGYIERKKKIEEQFY